MIHLSIALVILGGLAYLAFREYLQFIKPEVQKIEQLPADALEELKAEIVRIKTMLNIKTQNWGEKK